MNEITTKHLVIQALFRATANKHPDKWLNTHSNQWSHHRRFKTRQQFIQECLSNILKYSIIKNVSKKDGDIYLQYNSSTNTMQINCLNPCIPFFKKI